MIIGVLFVPDPVAGVAGLVKITRTARLAKAVAIAAADGHGDAVAGESFGDEVDASAGEDSLKMRRTTWSGLRRARVGAGVGHRPPWVGVRAGVDEPVPIGRTAAEEPSFPTRSVSVDSR